MYKLRKNGTLLDHQNKIITDVNVQVKLYRNSFQNKNNAELYTREIRSTTAIELSKNRKATDSIQISTIPNTV